MERDDAQIIVAATARLLRAMVERNGVAVDDIASLLFSVTPDLHSAFPASAAREMGWVHVPMLHFAEIDVEGSLAKCVRVLMHVNTELAAETLEHLYLDEAVTLRPDLAARWA